jgi:hypothetical protein
MKHYLFAHWVDYVRGLGEARSRAAMEQHLRDGCERCRTTVGALRELASNLAADARFEPPANVVRCARALFTQFKPERVRSLPRMLARLVQDTLREPLPAGVRGNVRGSRQVLYQAGEVFVDLRLEQRPGDPEVVLVGQLLCPDEAATRAAQPIVLTSGQKVLRTAACNEHGEFQMEYAPAGQMRLHIPVEDGSRRVEISLNRLMPGPRRGRAAERR